MQVAGLGAPLRIVLGMDCIGAQIGPIWVYNGKIYVRCIWALGEIEGVQSYTLNDQPPPWGSRAIHYTGTIYQGVDPWLAAAGAAQNPPVNYADTLVFSDRDTLFGIAYSVLELPFSAFSSAFTLKAVVKGLKLYDPRTGLRAWSDNAGLALREFLFEKWGENKNLSDNAVALADRCDELLGSGAAQEKRNRIGLTLDRRQQADAWRETLCAIAEAFVVVDGDNYLIIPDGPAEPEYYFNSRAESLNGNVTDLGQIKKDGAANLPTVITGWYTDRSVTPYRDAELPPIMLPGVMSGAVPWIPQEIRVAGVFSAGQMTRFCTTRLNKMRLCDLNGYIHALDDGIRVRPGTVVWYTDHRGLESKVVRIFGCEGVNGQITLSYREHDNAAYSDRVEITPTTPDTPMPLPNQPPSITGLSITESFVPNYGGRGVTRFFVSWNEVVYVFMRGYRVELWAGGQIVDSAPVSGAEYASPPLTEGVAYTIKVATLSNVAQSAWVQDARIAQGKLLKPGDPFKFSGFEGGGLTHFFIVPGNDLDLTAWEIRRAAINGGESIAQHWARGAVVNRVACPAIEYTNQNQPVGTWRYMAKMLDSVRNILYPNGQESANAAWFDASITSDAQAFLVDGYTFATPTLTNMFAYTGYPPTTEREWVTSCGTAWDTLFPNAMNTYTAALPTYDMASPSEFLTEAWDAGSDLSGQWTAVVSVHDFSGAATVDIELSDTGSPGTWTAYPGGSAKGAGRFVRLRIATTGAMWIDEFPAVRVDAVPKEEIYIVTTLASGPLTVQLGNKYIKATKIDTQLIGATQAGHSWDNVVVSATGANHVDVEAWNPQTGVLLAVQLQLTFRGIRA